MTIINLVKSKAGAKHELLFNELVSETGLLNKSSKLEQPLTVQLLFLSFFLSLSLFLLAGFEPAMF
jgi:hypothetical protein